MILPILFLLLKDSGTCLGHFRVSCGGTQVCHKLGLLGPACRHRPGRAAPSLSLCPQEGAHSLPEVSGMCWAQPAKVELLPVSSRYRGTASAESVPTWGLPPAHTDTPGHPESAPPEHRHSQYILSLLPKTFRHHSVPQLCSLQPSPEKAPWE